MKTPDAVDLACAEVMNGAHGALIALERFSESMHRLIVVKDVATADKDELGRIFLAHLRCCWDGDLNETVRARLRELNSSPVDTTNEAPF